jgi:hypothetical protein
MKGSCFMQQLAASLTTNSLHIMSVPRVYAVCVYLGVTRRQISRGWNLLGNYIDLIRHEGSDADLHCALTRVLAKIVIFASLASGIHGTQLSSCHP